MIWKRSTRFRSRPQVHQGELGAHVDGKIESWEAQEALARLEPAQVCDAIEVCLDALVALLSVHVLTDGRRPIVRIGFVKLMVVEPTLITFKMESSYKPSCYCETGACQVTAGLD